MKLNQILLFIVCANFTACNIEPFEDTSVTEEREITVEEEEEEEIDDSLILLKKTIETDSDGDTYTSIFTYEDNKLISVDQGDGWKNVYTYEDDLLVREDQFTDNLLTAYITLEYNGDEKLSSFTEYWLEPSGTDGLTYRHVISYNNNNTFIDEIYVGNANSQTELHNTKAYTLDGINIKEIAYDAFSTTLTYDDKNGMFKNVHSIEVLNILSENEFGALIYGNNKNITSYIEDDTTNSDNYNNSYDYTYNDNNYPITGVYTSKYGNEAAEISNIEFFYE